MDSQSLSAISSDYFGHMNYFKSNYTTLTEAFQQPLFAWTYQAFADTIGPVDAASNASGLTPL